MAVLAGFDTPGRLRELPDAGSWDARVRAIFGEFTGFAQLYDPTVSDTPPDAQAVPIVWAAFPASLLPDATSEEQRWALADNSRDVQDEYCEWSVERDADGTVSAVTFTTEVPEYWGELARRDPETLRARYRELTSRDVELAELTDGDGAYDPLNPVNRDPDGPLVHLSQENNTLGAAIALVAEATVQRDDERGVPVTTKQALAKCAGLGNEFRNSDPQIAAVVNGAAATGDRITLADPIGLYIDGLATTGFSTPDGANPASFWTIERGEPGHVVRASYRVPEGHDYRVGDVRIGNRPIGFGAQLADRVSIRITGLVSAGDHEPQRKPCGA